MTYYIWLLDRSPRHLDDLRRHGEHFATNFHREVQRLALHFPLCIPCLYYVRLFDNSIEISLYCDSLYSRTHT